MTNAELGKDVRQGDRITLQRGYARTLAWRLTDMATGDPIDIDPLVHELSIVNPDFTWTFEVEPVQRAGEAEPVNTFVLRLLPADTSGLNIGSHTARVVIATNGVAACESIVSVVLQ